MGGAISLAKESFPPKSNWGVDDIPDLTGKVIIVTGMLRYPNIKQLYVCSIWCSSIGGSTGIGKETAKVR